MSELQKVTVLGGGVLGGQIAWHSAFKGKDVIVYDPSDDALERCRATHDQYAAIYLAEDGATDDDIAATRRRLAYTSEPAGAAADRDLIIEAVPEIPEIKTKAYTEIAPYLAPHTLIATNTSTLLPRDFAEATGRPEKYCALHFANLVWAINMVEIMAHPGTAPSTLTAISKYAIEIGMIPFPVGKEQNGYILNTWLVQLLNAAQTLVTNGIATPEDVDRTYMITNPGAPRGPFGVIDVIGMEANHNVFAYWGEANGDEQMLANARHLKEEMMAKGRTGLLAGQGYYSYPNPAYADPDFLTVPDVADAEKIGARALLS